MNYPVTFPARLSAEQAEVIRDLAQQYQSSESTIVRCAVRFWLERGAPMEPTTRGDAEKGDSHKT